MAGMRRGLRFLLRIHRRRRRVLLRRGRRRDGRGRLGIRLQARLDFVHHAQVVHEFSAARVGEMDLAVGGAKNVRGAEVGLLQFCRGHAGGVKDDQESGRNGGDAHGEARLPQLRDPRKPASPPGALRTGPQSAIEDFRDQLRRGFERLELAHLLHQAAHLRDQLAAWIATAGVRGKRRGFGGRQSSVEIIAKPFFGACAVPVRHTFAPAVNSAAEAPFLPRCAPARCARD